MCVKSSAHQCDAPSLSLPDDYAPEGMKPAQPVDQQHRNRTGPPLRHSAEMMAFVPLRTQDNAPLTSTAIHAQQPSWEKAGLDRAGASKPTQVCDIHN